MRTGALLVVLIVAVGAWCPAAVGQEADPAAVIRAAESGVGVLVRDGLAWQQANNCVGCHVHGLGLSALAAAKRHGYAVNDADASALTSFAAAAVGQDGRIDNDYGAMDAATYIGPGLVDAADGLAAQVDPAVTALGSLIAYLIGADGTCKTESDRPPMLGDPHFTTAQGLQVMGRGLQLTSDFARYVPAREAAVSWMLRTPADSTEGIVGRLACFTQSRSPSFATRRDEILVRLQEEQNPDGGWGLGKGKPSNAYSTGQVLWAMSAAGQGLKSPGVAGGVAYLLSSRLPDGSWAAGSGVLSYAATAWATRALVSLVEAPVAQANELTALYDAAKAAPAAPKPTGTNLIQSAVTLPNPPPLQWGVSGETTLAGAVVAVLRYLGEEVTYGEVLAVSGGAFDIRWPTEGVSVAAGTLAGPEPLQHVLDGLGRKGAVAGPGEDERKWSIVTGAIDAGRPCVMGGATTEHGIVVGYDAEQHQIIGYLYSSDPVPEPKPRSLDSVEYIVDLGPKPAAALDPEQQLAGVLRIALNLTHSPPAGPMGHGPAAYAAWAQCLRAGIGVSPGETLSQEYVQANEWAFDVLVDARRAAADYLRSRIADLPSSRARHLLRAAEQYDALLAQLGTREFYVYTEEPGKVSIRDTLSTQEGRERFAKLLTDAAALDASATDELADALRSLGNRGQPPISAN